MSALQTKSFLAKSFLNNPVTISPQKTLKSCRGVISEPDRLTTPEMKILEGFFNHCVIQYLIFSAYHLPVIFINSSTSTSFHIFSNTNHTNQSHLPIPISTTATLDSSLITSASALSTETCLFATSNKFSPLSTEVQPSVPLPQSASTTSNSKPSDTSKIPKSIKQNSKNRRKSTTVQKPEIEIKMAPHKPRKSAPTEYATDDEDMIMYDVEEELEPNPADKFAMKECYQTILANICVRCLQPNQEKIEANFY
ncbi:hypothetical protein TNCV_2971021 [Trichonephila clavipes]|nr:hypothetical protein TNCV_2971021 [Trichonephila clavipes]